MSKVTTFELEVTASELDELAIHLSRVVQSMGCTAAHYSPPVSGPSLITLIRRLAMLGNTDECLVFAFEEDRMLLEFQAENIELKSARPNHVAVGCFWLACRSVEDRFLLAFTSASRSISDLMIESKSVQKVFMELSRHTANGQVQVINQWQESTIL